jgi:predicted Rossmann-fold nucleotide-binding protein
MVARLAFPPVRRVCVYAGSNPGTDPAYAGAARALAGLLAERDIGLVYGGGHVGLMGVLADTALAAGAR